MTMQGVAERWGAPRASALAVIAGADIVLGGGTAEVQIAAIREILDAVHRGEIPEKQIDASARRVLAVKDAYGLFDASRNVTDRDFIGTSAPFAADLARRSITLLRDGALPLRRGEQVTTLVAGVTQTTNRGIVLATHVPRYAELIERATGGSVVAWWSDADDPTPVEVREATSLAERTDQAVLFTHSHGELCTGQSDLVRAVQATGTPLAVVATGTPYDIQQFPDVPAYVATYMLSFVPMHLNNPHVLEAAVEVLFGAGAKGGLPVDIPGLFSRGDGITG
jgi:beta-N-acetylhexosaminidase